MPGEMLRGCVLSAAPVGEYDKRIVLLTREKGKFSGFARGARRPRSQLITCQPFAFGSFEVFEGKHSNSIVSAKISHPFTEISANLSAVWYASYFAELAGYYAAEGMEEAERIDLLYVALRALLAGKMPYPLIKLVYEFKSFVISGEYPNLFGCLSCGNLDSLAYFSYEKGGVLCSSCGDVMERRISAAALYTLQFITVTPPEKLFSFTLKQEVQMEAEGIVAGWRKRFFPHRFKSEDYLDLAEE